MMMKRFTVNYWENDDRKQTTIEAWTETDASDAFYAEYIEGEDAEIEVISIVEEEDEDE